MSVLTAAVVGLGNVGLELDYDSDAPEVVSTHCRAYATHPRFRLVAGIDVDAVQRRRFEERYHAPSYASVSAMKAALRPDVISVAVPTRALTASFVEAVACAPKAILCEKPFATSAGAGAASLELAREAGCAVMVNYVRRYEPGVRALKAKIDSGAFGAIQRGQAWYAKGLYNNGSHAIDLLRLLLGEAGGIEVLKPGRALGADCEPDFLIRFGEAEVWFLAHRHEHYSFGEIDLLGDEGRVLYARGGQQIDIWSVESSALFAGYRVLGAAQRIGSSMSNYQMHVLDGLCATLTQGAPNLSDAQNALATLRVLDDVAKQRLEHVR